MLSEPTLKVTTNDGDSLSNKIVLKIVGRLDEGIGRCNRLRSERRAASCGAPESVMAVGRKCFPEARPFSTDMWRPRKTIFPLYGFLFRRPQPDVVHMVGLESLNALLAEVTMGSSSPHLGGKMG